MKIFIPDNGTGNYKQFLFAAGENHVKIKEKDEVVNIYYSYTGDNSILTLLQITDAVKRNGAKEINLFIPYFPGARQDRVCVDGEALSVKVYANLINAQKYNKVVIFDPHSEVTPALLDNVVVVKNSEFVKHALRDIETIYRDEVLDKVSHGILSSNCIWDEAYGIICETPLVLISPDAGSNKKIFDLSKYLGGIEVVRADKTRDTKTGKLSNPIVYTDSLEGKIAVIVDDICSYGGTFKALAKELKAKGAAKIYLVVSHYEGVANLLELNKCGIDCVFTTNSLNKANAEKLLTIYDIWKFLC